MDIDKFIELLKSRRSIRAYKPDLVPDEFIQKIIEAARWAPSGGNSQPWEFIVIKRKEIKDRIADLFVESTKPIRQAELTREKELRVVALEREISEPGFKRAPVFILLCGDPRLNEAFPLAVYQKSGAEVLISNLASAFLCMQLAAKSLGLASQWVSATGGIMEDHLKMLLDIPREFKIYDMMAVGYPAYQVGPRSPRRIEEMTHYDRYDRSKLRTDEQIKDFIRDLRNKDREEMEGLMRGMKS
ncbi:MAG TPA: nitroreductase family protein [Thermodesulfobacteriota bacterium]|nr:nitroreductase family protein [Thermodesulfobacteriota bacterium]